MALRIDWAGRDRRLVPHADGYELVDADDARLHPPSIAEVPNLLVHADALTALRALHEHHAGTVQAVYLDPPYNARAGLSYRDRYQPDVWLTLMRDVIAAAAPLLAASGSIWFHLDAPRAHLARILLDDVLGPDSHIAQIAWQKSASTDARAAIARTLDLVTVAAPDPAAFRARRGLLPRTAATNLRYRNPDADPRGPWKPSDFTAAASRASTRQRYTLTTPAGVSYEPPPGRVWAYTSDRYEQLLADGRLYFGADGSGRPTMKLYLADVADGVVPTSVWTADDVGTLASAKRELRASHAAPFPTPKPLPLLERILTIASHPEDVVLDPFAGSGTTALAAERLERRWIAVERDIDTIDQHARARLTDAGARWTDVRRCN